MRLGEPKASPHTPHLQGGGLPPTPDSAWERPERRARVRAQLDALNKAKCERGAEVRAARLKGAAASFLSVISVISLSGPPQGAPRPALSGQVIM